MSKHLTKTLAVATVAAAILAIGAYSIGTSKPGNGVGTAAAAQPGAQGTAGQPPGGQPPTGRSGGAPPGMGADVTGATADKVAKAALAKYPGTIERVVKLPDGSYVAHVVRSQGEIHVAVGASFQVTGTKQGPPGGPPRGAPPQGATPQGTVPRSQDSDPGALPQTSGTTT